MTDYKQALDKAVEYIMQECEYCPICINYEPCNKQMEEYGKQGKTREIDFKLCKDGIRQHFLREAEKDNGKGK